MNNATAKPETLGNETIIEKANRLANVDLDRLREATRLPDDPMTYSKSKFAFVQQGMLMVLAAIHQQNFRLASIEKQITALERKTAESKGASQKVRLRDGVVKLRGATVRLSNKPVKVVKVRAAPLRDGVVRLRGR